MLKLVIVKKSFDGSSVLDGINLEIEDGEIVSILGPSGCGKTTLLKEVAMSVKKNYPNLHLIILLIDERPEEVTDMKETVEGPNDEVIYSTFEE